MFICSAAVCVSFYIHGIYLIALQKSLAIIIKVRWYCTSSRDQYKSSDNAIRTMIISLRLNIRNISASETVFSDEQHKTESWDWFSPRQEVRCWVAQLSTPLANQPRRQSYVMQWRLVTVAAAPEHNQSANFATQWFMQNDENAWPWLLSSRGASECCNQ